MQCAASAQVCRHVEEIFAPLVPVVLEEELEAAWGHIRSLPEDGSMAAAWADHLQEARLAASERLSEVRSRVAAARVEAARGLVQRQAPSELMDENFKDGLRKHVLQAALSTSNVVDALRVAMRQTDAGEC